MYILCLQVMSEAADKLIGEHDFRNFCKMDVGNGVVNFVRRIVKADISVVDERYYIVFNVIFISSLLRLNCNYLVCLSFILFCNIFLSCYWRDCLDVWYIAFA